MLALAGVGADDYVIDLGSGDGRIVIAAARRGARGLGVDIEPDLVRLSRDNAVRAGVGHLARFEQRDVMQTDLSRASVVTIYLLPWLVDRLQPKLLDELTPGARIVAHAFPMKGWRPDRREHLRVANPERGQSGESELFLWVVPAQARGRWRGGGLELDISQNFQEIEVAAQANGRPLVVERAQLSGREIALHGPGWSFRGRVEGARMAGEITRAGGTAPVALARN